MNELLTDIILKTIPNPDPLPVSFGWFQFLSYLTFYLHYLSVGIMMATAIAAASGYVRGKKNPEWLALGRRMSLILPFTIAFAINLGIAPLLFVQVLYGNFFYTATILMGIPWLLLTWLLIIIYYGAYWLAFRGNDDVSRRSKFSIIISVLLGLIAFMLVNVNTLMITPDRWERYYNHMNGFHLNLTEGTLYTRYVLDLFLLAAVGGMFIALFYKIKDRLEESKKGFILGKAFFAYFSYLSVPAFMFFLLSMNDAQGDIFLGKNLEWTSFALFFGIGLFLISFLAYKRRIVFASVVFLFDLILFVFIRDHVRRVYLDNFKVKFPPLAQHTQYDIMTLFFVILAIGLVVIAWLLFKVTRERGTKMKVMNNE
jgi:MFS family permease